MYDPMLISTIYSVQYSRKAGKEVIVFILLSLQGGGVGWGKLKSYKKGFCICQMCRIIFVIFSVFFP